MLYLHKCKKKRKSMIDEKSSKSDNYLDEKIKYEKQKIHCRYISCICIAISIWLITTSTYKQSGFIEQISFASTITSIILSVIAIILSITGEGKTEGIRNQMMETTQELRNTVKTVQGINKGVESSLEELKKGLNELQEKIDTIPDNTAMKLTKRREPSTLIEKKRKTESNIWME